MQTKKLHQVSFTDHSIYYTLEIPKTMKRHSSVRTSIPPKAREASAGPVIGPPTPSTTTLTSLPFTNTGLPGYPGQILQRCGRNFPLPKGIIQRIVADGAHGQEDFTQHGFWDRPDGISRRLRNVWHAWDYRASGKRAT
jgi:hypothetical protein